MTYEYEPPQYAPEPPSESDRVPWTVSDILKGIGLVILGIIVISFAAAGVAAAIAGGFDDIEDDPAALAALFAFSIPLEIVFVLVALRFTVWKYGLSLASLGLKRPERGRYLFTVGLLFGALAIVYVYFGILALFGVDPEADLPDEAFEHLGPIIVVGVLSLGFAPLMEEVFFRGFVFPGLQRRWGFLLAALGSGFLFGIAHLGNPGTFYVVPPITLVGAWFAWGYAYSGSLYPPIAAHFFFNLISFSVGVANA